MNIFNVSTGDKVIYTGSQGYPIDHERAAIAGLRPDGEYYVQAIQVEDFSSKVRLLGHPGWHNTVIFEDVNPINNVNNASQGCTTRGNASLASCTHVYGPAGTSVDMSAPIDAGTIYDINVEPEEREYFIEATIQTVVQATDGYAAALQIKERLADFIRDGYAANDPMHGHVINTCEEIPEIG